MKSLSKNLHLKIKTVVSNRSLGIKIPWTRNGFDTRSQCILTDVFFLFQIQIRSPVDPTQCISCPMGELPDLQHVICIPIPEEYMQIDSGWAIGAMAFSSTGMLITLFVFGVFIKHNTTPVVRASGRELSYTLLAGIMMCYSVTYALVLKPTDIVCGVQR